MERDVLVRWLQRHWQRRDFFSSLLFPLSLLFEFLVRMRRAAYQLGLLRSRCVSVPVVVVGNVVLGGSGKTPLVVELVKHFQSRGLRPGIVSRGYRGTYRQYAEVSPESLANWVGDEPLLLRQKTGVPVFVATQRLRAVQELLRAHPDVNLIISDDGLQHAALARDVEIIVFDDRGVGNGWLFPAGPLREPWPRHADFLIRTDGGRTPGIFFAQRHLADWARDASGTLVNLKTLRSHPLVALAGIARPEQFFSMLRARGLTLAHTLALPDHHDFQAQPVPVWQGMTLLCTEKDAPKLWPLQPQALAVPLQLTLEADFLKALDEILSTRGCQTA